LPGQAEVEAEREDEDNEDGDGDEGKGMPAGEYHPATCQLTQLTKPNRHVTRSATTTPTPPRPSPFEGCGRKYPGGRGRGRT